MVGGGGDIQYAYRLTSDGNIYVISEASTIFSKKNLDNGRSLSDSTRVYATVLNNSAENFVTGMILPEQLGGNGEELANVFPQSSLVHATTYHKFVERIYHCLDISDESGTAMLRWECGNAGATDTRPQQIYQTVTFQKHSKCRSTSMTFDN